MAICRTHLPRGVASSPWAPPFGSSLGLHCCRLSSADWPRWPKSGRRLKRPNSVAILRRPMCLHHAMFDEPPIKRAARQHPGIKEAAAMLPPQRMTVRRQPVALQAVLRNCAENESKCFGVGWVYSAAASSVTPPPAPAAVPPIVVSIATPPTRTSGTPRQREASGSSGSSRSSRSSNSRSPESNSATSSRSRSQSRKPVSARGSVADRVSRSKAIKGGAKLKSAAKTITPVSSSGMARSASGDSGSAGRTAASLASRLRNRGRFQQAILMAELLQPPVALRPPTSGDHHE